MHLFQAWQSGKLEGSAAELYQESSMQGRRTRVDGIALTCHKTHCMTHVVAKQLRVGVSEQFHVAAACMNMQQCRGLTLKAVLLQQVTIQIALQDLGKS